jgi:hypothetical protein
VIAPQNASKTSEERTAPPRASTDFAAKEENNRKSSSSSSSGASSAPAAGGVAGLMQKLGGMIPDIKLSRGTIIKLNYARLVAHMLLLWACIFTFFLLSTQFGASLYYKVFMASAALSILNMFLTYGVSSFARDLSLPLPIRNHQWIKDILCECLLMTQITIFLHVLHSILLLLQPVRWNFQTRFSHH